MPMAWCDSNPHGLAAHESRVEAPLGTNVQDWQVLQPLGAAGPPKLAVLAGYKHASALQPTRPSPF